MGTAVAGTLRTENSACQVFGRDDTQNGLVPRRTAQALKRQIACQNVVEAVRHSAGFWVVPPQQFSEPDLFVAFADVTLDADGFRPNPDANGRRM